MESTLEVQETKPIETNLTLVDKPKQTIRHAVEVAKELKAIVEETKCFTQIGNKKHLHVEGWQTIGAFFGAIVGTEWTRPIQDKEGKILGYEACAVVYKNGVKISPGAEAMCLLEENNWNGKDLYALRSMAQTRAQSKALSSVFRWIPILAGYSGTPAEEMSEEFLKLPEGWRKIKAKFPKICPICEKEYRKNSDIYYNFDTKKAQCINCPPEEKHETEESQSEGKPTGTESQTVS